jgi:hypothetical protein
MPVTAGIVVTDTGGASWTSIITPVASGDISGTWCLDAQRCMIGEASATDAPVAFAVTADGGVEWTTQTVPSLGGEPGSLKCDGNGRCLAVTLGSGTVAALTSMTWGGPWTAEPPVAIGDSAIIYRSCADATHCMLVALGTSYEIITTSDAGLTWHVAGPPAGWLNMPTAVGCANDTHCWIAMSLYDTSNPDGAYSHPVIESTTDFGVTWTPLSLPSTSPAIADVLTLSCPPSGDGCLAIGNGKDHFILPSGPPHPLSGPILLSSLP